MKKPLSFVTLLAFAALILTSCGGLESPKNETGRFEFKVTDEMITAISRAVTVTDDTTCTITLHLYSTDGNSYYKEQTRSDRLSALKGSTFDPFTDIPLGIELNLTVDVKTGGELVFTSAAKKFTLTETAPNLTLRIQMNRVNCEMDTPYMIAVYDPVDDQNVLHCLPSESSFNAETGDLASFSSSNVYSAEETNYCFDADNNVWYMSYPDSGEILLCISDGTTTIQTEITFDDENLFPDVVRYDAYTNKICILCDIWISDTETYYYIAELNPEEYRSFGSTIQLKKDDMVALEPGDERFPTLIYIDHGYLYAIDDAVSFTVDGARAKILKYALKDNGSVHAGDLVTTGLVFIPRARTDLDDSVFSNGVIENGLYLTDNPESVPDDWNPDYNHFIFNDIGVYDNSVYILFHQKEIWGDNGYDYNQTQNTYTAGTGISGGFVDRGGIFVLDADSLETTDTLGLTGIQDKLKIPEIVSVQWRKTADDNSSTVDLRTFSFSYTGSDYSTIATKDFDITFSVPDSNAETILFSNPLKIVAIKPKKLVIADSGVFYYIDPDKDEQGKPVVKTDNAPFIHSKQATRLITVDLEDFSNSFVTTVFTDEANDAYNAERGSLFMFPLTGGTATVYYPEIDFSYSSYTENGQTQYVPSSWYTTGNASSYCGEIATGFNYNGEALELPF